jgi:hypothetical protein
VNPWRIVRLTAFAIVEKSLLDGTWIERVSAAVVIG